ncbi:hypothetical protein [Streptomyces sp. NPDC058401]|uniref:hypothetical protein n=1 Tax=Streptomyces sp. NPDC058401 TaxID=3346480 RepID=UPI003664A6F9
MRFRLGTDKTVTVVFEPSAAEHTLEAGESIIIEWFDGIRDDGFVRLDADCLVVDAPSHGYTRAWEENGEEIYVGSDSE